MNSYASIADMARVATKGWADLAQRTAQDARMTGAILRAVVEGGDVSTVPPDVLALAQAAALDLSALLERTSRHADTYIQPRYQRQMPLRAEVVAGSDLATVVATIALRRLMGTSLSDDAERNTKWADQYLRDLASGVVSLGAEDFATPQPPGRMVSSTVCKQHDWERY